MHWRQYFGVGKEASIDKVTSLKEHVSMASSATGRGGLSADDQSHLEMDPEDPPASGHSISGQR